MRRCSTRGWLEAGPMVATIFVRRIPRRGWGWGVTTASRTEAGMATDVNGNGARKRRTSACRVLRSAFSSVARSSLEPPDDSDEYLVPRPAEHARDVEAESARGDGRAGAEDVFGSRAQEGRELHRVRPDVAERTRRGPVVAGAQLQARAGEGHRDLDARARLPGVVERVVGPCVRAQADGERVLDLAVAHAVDLRDRGHLPRDAHARPRLQGGGLAQPELAPGIERDVERGADRGPFERPAGAGGARDAEPD